MVGVFFFQAEDGIRDLVRSRGLGDVYKRQPQDWSAFQAFDHSHEHHGSEHPATRLETRAKIGDPNSAAACVALNGLDDCSVADVGLLGLSLIHI